MAALLVALAGCEKEPQAVKQQQTGEEIGAGEKVYMSLKIQAVDTRSGTDTGTQGGNPSNSDAAPDYEVGLDHENTISKVNVVLKNNDKFIVASVVSPTYKEGTWIATFNSGSLISGEIYDVYIYANCSAAADEEAKSTASIADMTKSNEFWMTNAYQPTSVTIPQELSTNQEEPTSLGSHFVERSMARFDYMAVKQDNEYPLTGVNSGVTVTLTEAAIINQSKEFYLLRHATKTGNSTANENIVIGYPETANNYVIDTDWDLKDDTYATGNASKNFDYHLSTSHTSWPWKVLSELDQTDNWTGTDGGSTGISQTPTHGYNNYMVFGYAKENTLPSPATQINGLSTGVVFKGVLSGDMITNASEQDIYAYNGTLYGTWSQVVSAAAGTGNDADALKAYVEKIGDEITTDDQLNALATAGFTRYKCENGEYNVYYYYWNRHNDNKNNKEMGDMEFAVVRNNIYKLCVDYINKLGHPAPTEVVNPDPVQETDPDESSDYYFGVSVTVVPWVVRVNHIGW